MANARTALVGIRGRGAEDRRRRSEIVDGMLIELAGTAGLAGAGAALVAVGGHGRRELSPHSDLDLMLLHPSEMPDAEAALLAERLWYPIWDSGIRLDHSVRSVDTARRVARADLPAMLGMLDLRHIAGDPVPAVELFGQVLADWRADARERLPALLAAGAARAERSGELAYAAVPDLKESRGGLRDLSAMRAVAASWVADCPHRDLAEARADLLEIRDALRLLVDRAVDRVQVQDQDALADALGIGDRDDLMRRISGVGRVVSQAADLTWYRVARALSRSRTVVAGGSGPRHQRRPLADGIVEQDGEAVLARSVDPAADPALALRLGAAAALAGVPVAPAALLRVVRAAPPMPVPWPDRARRSLVEMLGAGPPLAGVWEALDQAGVIAGALPGWARLRSLPQRDPVHRHTVDRHLVQTAIEAAALVRGVDRPDLLLVGALLHDVGKGTGLDHSLAGADIAREWLAHMGFPPADAAVVVGLVRHHLLLAETAVRRDPDDPETIEAVAREVGNASHLALLAALTEADARAAGPATWTPWRAGQVRVLASRVRALLDGRLDPAAERAAGDGAGAGAAAPSPAAAVGPLPAAPSPVAAVVAPSPPDVAADGADAVRIAALPGGVAVTVAVPDRPGLLAAAAGVLALHGLTIRSASVSVTQGRALQDWTVTPRFGDGPDEAALRADLIRALAGAWDVAATVAARRGLLPTAGSGARADAGAGAGVGTGAGAVAAPMVRVVPGASRRSTVLEVRARDAPALVFVVARAVAALGVAVLSARIDTFGADAVDAFYLRRAGRPLDPAEEAAVVAAVRRDLMPLSAPTGSLVR